MTYVRLLVATVNDPIVAAINAYTLKNIVQGTAAAATIVNTPAPIVTR
jgi:polysaccharide export outer membrane protein